jgi:hypothetical protein
MISDANESVPRRGMRLVLACGLALVLPGCLGEGTDGGLGFLTDKSVSQTAGGVRAMPQAPKKTPLNHAVLAGGKVVVQGPRGYCVDPATLRRSFTGGFALIAACNTISGELSGADAEPVVMTVQAQPGLSRKDAPTAAELATALAPERALERVDGDGLSLVHMAGGGDKGLPQGDPRHWRGAMMINGYLVGLAVYAPKGSASAGKRGKRLILALAETLRAASPSKSYAPQATVTKPKKQ